MGWSIANLVNNVMVTDECAKELRGLDVFGEFGANSNPVYEGKLQFSSDDMEHMDYLSEPDVMAVLLRHQVEGDVCFGSLEGDNFGEFWGYSFSDGEVSRLVGKLVWEQKKF